jgi:hypothetical protein
LIIIAFINFTYFLLATIIFVIVYLELMSAGTTLLLCVSYLILTEGCSSSFMLTTCLDLSRGPIAIWGTLTWDFLGGG